MPRQRSSPTFADRVDAGVPISAALVSAVCGEPIEFAERFVSTWFDATRTATMTGDVLVFDDFVVGTPCPLLLETAHRVRLMRRAEQRGLFDDEEERWYEEHPDDCLLYTSLRRSPHAVAGSEASHVGASSGL